MNNFTKILFCGILFIACCAANQVAVAEEEDVSTIEQREYQGIPYVSGGIGLDEREEIAAIGKNYSLKLVFAIKSGEYLSDVKVEISNSVGKKVLDAVADGPWFFTNLAPGKYTITVTMNDKQKQNKVNIVKGQKQISLSFYWNE
jgi:hypothetical protein